MRVNLDSNIWGAHGWFFCESICLGYPDNPTNEVKQQYKNFFYSFPYIIPCYKCRLHFSEHIKKYPLNNKILSSKYNLIIWMLSAHNNVKRMNNKKQITLKKFYKYYNKMYNMDVTNNTCKESCMTDNAHFMNNYNYVNLTILIIGIIIAVSLYIIRLSHIELKK
jgi:hypothetical protein